MQTAANIDIQRLGDEVTIIGTGEMDLTNSQLFREALAEAAAEAEDVTVDLRPVTFIDTAILDYLARAGKALISREKRLQVLTTQYSHPLRVLRTVGFAALMDIQTFPPSP